MEAEAKDCAPVATFGFCRISSLFHCSPARRVRSGTTSRRALRSCASAATHGLVRALDGGALLEDGIERRWLRGRCGEVAGKVGERQIGLAGQGDELVEGSDVAMPGSEDVERGLLLFDFGLQNVGRVGLTDVGELARRLSSVGGKGAEL